MQRKLFFLIQSVILILCNCECSAFDWKHDLDYTNLIPINFEFWNAKKKLFTESTISLRNSFHQNHVDYQQKYEDVKCLADMNQVKQSVNKFEQWAVKMIDSWGKLPSGILSGNLFEFGDFAQCFSVKAAQKQNERYIQPQYCLAKLNVSPKNIADTITNQRTKNISAQIHKRNIGQTFLLSKSARGIHFGICVPGSCSPSLVETILTDLVGSKVSNASVHVSYDLCQFEENYTELETIDIVTIALLVTIFCLIIVSTFYDVISTINKKQKIQGFLAFSVITNGGKIFSCKQTKSADAMHCLHGIRAISTAWIIYGHTCIMYVITPARNMAVIEKLFAEYHNMLPASATIAVDTFLVISGMLVSVAMLKHFEKKKCKLNLPLIYLHRFLRLTPLLAVSILFSSSLFKFLGNGPLWPRSIDIFSNYCKRNWWTNLLYIQNYVNADEMCFVHSWYLAVDMQLFILAPFIVYLIYRYKAKFVVILGFLILLCIGGTIKTYLNVGSRQMSLTYYPTHIRFSSWLIGVIFGYNLFNTRNKKVHISNILNGFAWMVSFILMLIVILSNYPLMQPNRKSLSIEFGLYDSLSRVAWSLALCYIIFACVHNYGGPVNWFLSLPQWQPLSRLSYAIYLIHLPVILLMMATLKSPFYISDTNAFHSFVGNYGFTLFVSLIASLAFELPVVVLEKLLFNKHTKQIENSESKRMDE